MLLAERPLFSVALVICSSWIFDCPSRNPTAPASNPVPLSILFTPPTLVVGQAAVARVQISGPAPAGGLALTISATPSQFVEIPPVVTVPAGRDTVVFTVTARTGFAGSYISIQVLANGVQIQTQPIVSVAPAPRPPLRLTAISLDTDDVPCGVPITGTLSLNRPVETDDPRAVVVGVSSDARSDPPQTVLVMSHGTTSRRFTVQTPHDIGSDVSGTVGAFFQEEQSHAIATSITVFGCLGFYRVVPAEARQGEALDVTLRGFNFRSPVSVRADGISVSNVQRIDDTTVSARFDVAAAAATGPRRVVLETPTGTKWVSFTVTSAPPAPAITSISPASGDVGFSVPVTITGTNFTGGASVAISGGDVTISGVTVVNSTTITATFGIGQFAAAGARNVTVTTPDGTSNAVTFTINP